MGTSTPSFLKLHSLTTWQVSHNIVVHSWQATQNNNSRRCTSEFSFLALPASTSACTSADGLSREIMFILVSRPANSALLGVNARAALPAWGGVSANDKPGSSTPCEGTGIDQYGISPERHLFRIPKGVRNKTQLHASLDVCCGLTTHPINITQHIKLRIADEVTIASSAYHHPMNGGVLRSECKTRIFQGRVSLAWCVGITHATSLSFVKVRSSSG